MDKTVYMLYILLAFILFTACTSSITQEVEVTRLVPHTVQVTVITTPVSSAPVNQTQEPENEVYFEGIIVIAQYYKLFDQALFENAYQLLGASTKQHSPSLEDHIASSTRAFGSVKVVVIQPYDEWVGQQGHPLPRDPELK